MNSETRFTLKHLDRIGWGWIHFKFALGIVWPVLILAAVLDGGIRGQHVSLGMLATWFGLCMIGALFSIAGIVMQAQASAATMVRGLALELAGIIFMFTGPFLLLVLYTVFAMQGREPRFVVIGLCYALCAAMVARWMEVFPRRPRGGKP